MLITDFHHQGFMSYGLTKFKYGSEHNIMRLSDWKLFVTEPLV